jgi:hypothetical protein
LRRGNGAVKPDATNRREREPCRQPVLRLASPKQPRGA